MKHTAVRWHAARPREAERPCCGDQAVTRRSKMHSVRIGQGLAAALTISGLLLIAGMVGIGMAIQQRTLAPPQLDMWLGRSHIVASATHMPDCAPIARMSCPPDRTARRGADG